ncbi:hypothetical protein INR49_003096 [Caranx melampygus]|nr:hypothetical protein INR49_003096 [Caranx melampygus]
MSRYLRTKRSPIKPLDVMSLLTAGSVFADGEASLRLIHLHGGAASIQQDSINAAWLNVHINPTLSVIFPEATERQLESQIFASDKDHESELSVQYLPFPAEGIGELGVVQVVQSNSGAARKWSALNERPRLKTWSYTCKR